MDFPDPLRRGLRWLALASADFSAIAGAASFFGWFGLGGSELSLSPATTLGIAALGAAVCLCAVTSLLTLFIARKRFEKSLSRERNLLRTVIERTETQLHEAQLQLIQAEKLESLGRLAAGIAHEVKNPLAMIQMSADYLADVLAPAAAGNGYIDEAAMEVVNGIRESVQRADTIIREMLDFASPKPLDLQPTDLNALIASSLLLVRHELEGSEVKLDAAFADNLPRVALDANKLKQVFINLFTNAVHAMHGGGTLRVRTSVGELSAADAAVREEGSRSNSRCRAGDHVVQVCIEDGGTGILSEKLANAFDPFFTTKATGKGTGLGLTVTKKIIELHGGEIRLANRPEGGLRVTLLFHAWTGAPGAGNSERKLATGPLPDAERPLPVT